MPWTNKPLPKPSVVKRGHYDFGVGKNLGLQPGETEGLVFQVHEALGGTILEKLSNVVYRVRLLWRNRVEVLHRD